MRKLKSRLDHINNFMKRIYLIIITFSLSICYSQNNINSRQIPSDIKVITNHSTIILGEKINYSAQVGTQPIWDESGDVIATLHYTYYKRTDINDNSNRPLVFSFNGGPGSA
jgi:carboxypeptidase C (cathepsin A)